MDPVEFLNLADILSKKDDPASLRTSISRSYYAAQHRGIQFLKEHGLVITSNHGDVWNTIGSSKESDLKAVCSILGTLHNARRKADYFLDNKNIEKKGSVQQQLNDAKSVFVKLNKNRTIQELSEIIIDMENFQIKLRILS